MIDRPHDVLLLAEPGEDFDPIRRTLGLFGRLETRSLHATAAPRSRPDVVVMRTPAMAAAGDVQGLRSVLAPFLALGIPVLALLDDLTVHAAMQAATAGAVSVMPITTPVRTLALEVRELARRGMRPEGADAPARTPLALAVEDVGLKMAELLNDAAAGRVDLAASGRLSGSLLDAVRANGMGDWVAAIGRLHQPTLRHCLLMAGVMASFVAAYGFNENERRRLIQAAILHDIGKVLVPSAVLDKVEPLSSGEWAMIRRHPELGADMLRSCPDHDPLALEVTRSHHEHLDGTGYPDGLRGSQISDPVRLATICDVFAALIEPRAYKPAITPVQAYDTMAAMRGQLDQELLAGLRRLLVQT